ncbi:MAG: hypothetical protein A2Z21_02540 [Candidatus Fraserbacteria bacterium RBG_16_55_9]|uniref:S-adenosyl-l-methionine hydroxide adenosyltransferase n=1 Tax=Fraserbacteria sp. (strain RBG_16_55_9) TaxID=1817864 RepID=A0A1F5V081_FRAXR|nr:MAG: hypothetical protein A2Z21_02540 [Candidatus Fraserbacteria bacterium RBG_16_55_9]
MKRVLTFLSDFGSNSPYPAAVKAVAAHITDARFVDITHEIRAHDIQEGAFVLWCVARYYPAGTVHCAVVDPGVGTQRRGLILTSGEQYFVGPDNGLLSAAAQSLGNPYACEITNSPYVRSAMSSTFHGRDVFAPAAAHLANGVPLQEIGFPITDWTRPEYDFQGGRFLKEARELQGRVIYLDRFGNAITNIPAKLVEKHMSFDQELLLRRHGQEVPVRLRRSYGFALHRELCLVFDSHDLLEIAVREGNAQETLGLQLGERVTLRLA